MDQTKLNVALTNAVRDAVAPPDVAATTQAVPAIVAAVAPVVTHATNNEPWYQSRVALGSVATIVSSAFAIGALAKAGSTDGELYAPLITAIAGAAFALYGRFKATRPLGS